MLLGAVRKSWTTRGRSGQQILNINERLQGFVSKALFENSFLSVKLVGVRALEIGETHGDSILDGSFNANFEEMPNKSHPDSIILFRVA